MKNLIIVGVFFMWLSCNQKNDSLDTKDNLINYDSFSFDIILANRNVLYFYIESKSDSLLFIRQSFNDSITSKVRIKLTQGEIMEMKRIIVNNLKLSILDNNSSTTFEGQAASFVVKKGNKGLSSKYSRLSSMENISTEFATFLKNLRNTHAEINKYF